MDRRYVMQLVRSFQMGHLTRRAFLQKATVALGSAATASALLAACAGTPAETPPPADEARPTTDADPSEAEMAEIITEDVSYEDTDGETLMGYLARPSDGDAHPAVVVIQEWWGLNEHIKDVTRRFAREGYVALAPDLYHGEVTTEPNEAQKLVMQLDMAEAVREIQRAIAFLQQQGFTQGEVGIVGFCMGGGLVLQTALVEEAVGAAVAFYGSPLAADQAATVTAPVLGLYGENDGGIPVEQVREMEQGLAEGGVPHEVHVYEGAGHAFFNDTRSSYDADAATDAWQRTLAWFGEYL